jgi:DNA-nicking Smr family endonuclease
MERLDLHGLRHHEVQPLIEDFVLGSNLPVKIITGNSYSMQEIVRQVVDKYELNWEYESYWNLGAMIISERR